MDGRTRAYEPNPFIHPHHTTRTALACPLIHTPHPAPTIPHTQKRCELCSTTFQFRPVYAPDAPARLSLPQLLEGVGRRLWKLAPQVLRHAVVGLLWLGLLPLLTSLLFQAYFLPSLAHAATVLPRRCFPLSSTTTDSDDGDGGGLPFLLASTIGGWLLCVTILMVSLQALWLKDAVVQQARALMADEEGEGEGQGEGQGEGAEQEQPGVAEGAGVGAAPPPPPPVVVQGQGQGLEPVADLILMDFREVVGLQGPIMVGVVCGTDGGEDACFVALLSFTSSHGID